MDVSFTNVLEGARQYFQGLPVPSTSGAATSVDHNLAISSTNSTSSTSATHDHGVSQLVATQAISISTPTSNSQESNHYNTTDTRPTSVENSSASSGNFWNPSMEPYPPQPTRVEVPDTRPGDEGTAMEPSSSSMGTVTLTEMQPSSSSSSSNFSRRPPASSSSSSSTSSSSDHNNHNVPHPSIPNSSSHLHQMPPSQQQSHSPGPVYQQLNNVNRTSFSTTEMLASSHTSTYQTANDRQSQSSIPIAPQRTQYYPRYHHPDITKCAPTPFSQSSIYQSANVAVTSPGPVQPTTRPTPVEQNNALGISQGYCQQEQQRVPDNYGNVAQSQNSLGGSTTMYGPSSSQSYSMDQHQQARLVTSANMIDGPHNSDVSVAHSSSSSPVCSSINPCSPRQHGSSSSHIPSPHLPSPLSAHHHNQQHQQPPLQQQQQQQQQQQHVSRINSSPHSLNSSPYGSRVLSTSSSSVNHSQQMPPPTNMSGYRGTTPSPHELPPRHATPSPHRQSPHMSTLHNPHASSPHHTPSPHNNFQPRSPTYPPPPLSARLTPHSYNVPATSQHYQTTMAYASNPYASPPPQSSYHSFQKSPQPSQGSYYSQSNRSHNQSYVPQMLVPSQTVLSGIPASNSLNYQQAKHVTYNSADVKRNVMDTGSYGTHRSSVPVQRIANTHNLPPIAALSSYHSNRREVFGKSGQSVQRQRSAISKASAAVLPTSAIPQRSIAEYPMTSTAVNHTIPINGRTSAVTNTSYSAAHRYPGQPGYSSYATTIAPSHHGNNSTNSTTVTSISGTARSSVPAVSAHTYQSSEETDQAESAFHHSSVRTTESYTYKKYLYQNSTSSSSQSTTAVTTASSSSQNSSVRKRESPLDLSVKTVKTSADSTAQDDIEITNMDKHVSSSHLGISRNSANRSMPPPSLQSATVQAPTYLSSYEPRPSSNGIRNPMTVTSVRASTPQTVCAPKVDFLPDFNSAPSQHHTQPHENALRRSTTQQLYVPPTQPLSSHHVNNTTSLPHMSTFKKRPLPTTSLYDGLSIPTPPTSSSSSPSYRQMNNSTPSRFSKYPSMIDPSQIGPPTLPVQDYPPDSSKYYLESRTKFGQLSQYERVPFKRTGEPICDISYSKTSRTAWPGVAIDKYNDQKLSATSIVLNEQQKRQEINVPIPLSNGALVSPSAYDQSSDNNYSASQALRYPQAYCDKRNYLEPKAMRSSPPYSHSVISKSVNVPSSPQQLSGLQPTYSNYRQGQKAICPTSGISSGQSIDQPSNTGADKRVLSLLRNSLENKQQREEQLNNGQQPILVNHSQQSFQNKVVAPVEPKTNIGRHNLSPFTAASLLERNSNTPPHYKFHVPRAVDSITQEVPRSLYGSKVNASATLPGKEALLGPRGAENQIHRDKDDGLAAILAAKIRTKAELKQVGISQFTTKSPSIASSSTPKDIDSSASTSTPPSVSSASSPPKLTREKTACLPPRRRLFSKSEEDNMPVAAMAPMAVAMPLGAPTMPTRSGGFRSSSETSVFDFRESDSEGEMPVLERQTLEEMRRDRKQLSKVQPPIPLNDAMCMNMTSPTDLVKIELKENDQINEVDPFWSATCDKFMEQLRVGDNVKKRGRRKKLCNTSKFEGRVDDSDRESDTNTSHSQIRPEDIKKEVQHADIKIEDKGEETVKATNQHENSLFQNVDIKIKIEVDKDDDKHSTDDSDEIPLIKRKTKHKMKKEDSDCEEEGVICRKKRTRRGSRIKLASSSGSDSSSEESEGSTEFGSSVADRLRARKRPAISNAENEGMKLRSRDMTPHKVKTEKESKLSPPKGGNSQKGKPKPLFGDGSDFRPGWEEEVYVYKKSLRMPPRLITVSKPSRFHRLSTSLPDLDPGSPALSVSMDSSDLCLRKKLVDSSDVESNCSFSVTGLGSKIDDEEATSSTTISCPPKGVKHSRSENSSIIDVLAQKVGSGKKDSKRKLKEKEKGTKVLNKSNNEPELLPTPSLAPLLPSEMSKNSKGKTPLKNNKSLKPIKVTDSVLLGYFRKETVNNFRNAFKNNHTLPNEFSTLVLKSRTRTETKVLKKQATIREVFGEDRPASAPPMQNHDDTSQDDDSQTETPDNRLRKVRTLKQKVVSRLRSAGILRSNKAIMNSKRHLLSAKRRKDLLKSLAHKKLRRIKTEVKKQRKKRATQEEPNDAREEDNNDIEDDKNDSETPNKKRLKFRTGRRKFRSGFDYIRKKKRPLKKDEVLPKERKRQMLSKPNPECVADIQSEIRTWVIKKGVGETVLHRAARLGYTDVTAYCLEKLNSIPSAKDNAGYTPLHEACSKGHLEIAKLLLAYGANASESANGGIRPLHEAAENGATELVRLLLSYGADPLLATYSGQTPLMLAVDTEAYSILEQHLADVQARTTVPWSFIGPASVFESEETGYNPFDDPPLDSPESELDDVEMEVSDVNLPVLFILNNDPDKWMLLQDLMAAVRIKSRDALLRQINPKAHSGPPAVAHREVMREMKLADFLEQSRCCHLLSGGERINMRGSKVTLIKYNDKVKSLLNVEKVLISLR